MSVNFPSPITITRYNAGSYGSDGVWVPASPETTTVTVNGNIQPISATSRDSDQESVMREDGAVLTGEAVLRCNEQVYSAVTSTAQQGDRLTWEGNQYEVIHVKPRGILITHYWALLALVQQNTEGSAAL